ncbi:hypothetical protein [Melghiribacillus thermohalophilus]|nr:hypothetical protein [Melghiribacillus thermohalophilus]
MGIVKLTDRYSLNRLEEACMQASVYSTSPKLNSIKPFRNMARIKVLIRRQTIIKIIAQALLALHEEQRILEEREMTNENTIAK